MKKTNKALSLMLVIAMLAGIFAMSGTTAFAQDDIVSHLTYEIKNGEVFIGGEKIMNTEHEDQLIYVGIRPEAFLYEQNKGVLTLNLDFVEVMGRDKSVVTTHVNSTKPTVRAIVDADIKLADTTELKFNLRYNKVFLFNRESEMRLR